MGTEINSKLKSVKSSTKPKRKVIPFTDHSIEAWRPKKDRVIQSIEKDDRF